MILPLFAWLVAAGAIGALIGAGLVTTRRGSEAALAMAWLSAVAPWGLALVASGPQGLGLLVELMFVPGVELESGVPLLWLSPVATGVLGWVTWRSRASRH